MNWNCKIGKKLSLLECLRGSIDLQYFCDDCFQEFDALADNYNLLQELLSTLAGFF
jgi:hypothetical protein